jgi:threonine dehydrogenase-like Zn-dependent dehydrogenase
MQCLRYQDGRLRLAREPFVDRSNEAVVRVHLAGICGTDLHILNGYAQFSGIPGHEFVGTVEAAPDDQRQWIGRRVVGEINVGCGSCAWCAAGVKEHCLSRTVIGIRERDGAFAELLSLPVANLLEVPAHVGDQAAVFTEPIAAACRILEQVALTGDHRVAVLGDGRLGLLTAQVLRTTGARVTVRGRHARKLAVAHALGLESELDSAASSTDYDVVVDATGRAEGLTRCLELVKPRGTVILKTTCHGDSSWPAWTAVVDEITLIGSRCGPFAPALRMLASGAVQTAPLVAGTLPLAEYASAFELARRELKVLFSL